MRQDLGVGALRRQYGGSNKRKGTVPEHFAKAAGGVIRHILQTLETVGLVEKSTTTKGGRRITPQGQRDLDLIAGRVGVDAGPLFGAPLEAGDVEETEVVKKGNLTYYRWLVKPLLGSTQRHAVAATAVGNRVFILTCAAKPREWKRAGAELKAIAASFTVPGG